METLTSLKRYLSSERYSCGCQSIWIMLNISWHVFVVFRGHFDAQKKTKMRYEIVYWGISLQWGRGEKIHSKWENCQVGIFVLTRESGNGEYWRQYKDGDKSGHLPTHQKRKFQIFRKFQFLSKKNPHFNRSSQFSYPIKDKRQLQLFWAKANGSQLNWYQDNIHHQMWSLRMACCWKKF